MNKRDLIKALFKNPTIKALYESGHFDASDINRAILMEASDENEYYLKELKKQVKELKRQFDEVAAKAAKVRGEKSAAAAKPLVAKRKEIGNQIKELEAKIARLVTKDIAITKAAAETETDEDDKVAGAVSVAIADKLEKLQFDIKTSSSDLNQKNLDHELDQISKSTKAAVDDIIPAIEKEKDAVKAAKAGEKVDAEKTAKQLPAGKGWNRAKVSIRQQINDKELNLDQIKNSLESVDAFKELFGLKSGVEEKMAQAQKLFDDGWIAGEIKRLAEKASQAQSAEAKQEVTEETENVAATVMSFYDFLQAKSQQAQQIQIPQNFKFPEGPSPKSEEEFEKKFIVPIEQAMGGESQSTDGSSVELANDPQAFISTFDRYLKDDDVLSKVADLIIKEIGGAYITLSLKPELFKAPEVEMAPMLEPKYPLTEGDAEESRNRISGNFPNIETLTSSTKSKMSKQASIRLRNTLISGDDELERVLARIKNLIDDGKISINKPEASQQPAAELETREQKLLTVQQQQKEALQQNANPEADKDLGALEQVEMDSAWKEQLDTFFGKNPGSPSFMRRLLLRDQAKMLYSMIATLDKIIQGPRNKGDELEASSLSDQYNEDQPKDSLEEQVINEIFSSLFGNKEKNEPVELSKESRGHMRQDLEAMVGLLRSLKEDIRGYSRFATSSSVDPRFDGSTLKKAMDAKLAVVQERIAMLTVQIETSISQQDRQVAVDATQELEEVMDLLSEADESERRMKIKKVREVYDEMRRLYIDGLMTSLQNNEPRKSKESAKRIKDYVMEQKDFLSFFPSNIVSGGTVMTLGNAYESMKAIIGKFIDTIRDVVTITKTQNVSKESLALASRDLIGIAEAIESMFKVPSKIGSDFVKKYKEAAASDPNNQSITNEQPQEDGKDSDSQDIDMLGFIKNWFSEKASDLAGKVSEKLLKALANGFKGKNLNVKSEEGKKEAEEMLALVQKPLSWFETLDEDSKNALSKLVDHLISKLGSSALSQVNLPANIQEAISEKERGEISGFTSKAKNTFEENLQGKIIEFLNTTEEDTKSLLIKMMTEKTDDLIEYLSSIFKVKEKLGDETAMAMVDPSKINDDEPITSGSPSEDELDTISYADEKEVKIQLSKDFGEKDPIVLEYLYGLLTQISSIIDSKTSSQDIQEDAFSKIKKFGKGLKRSVTTNDSKAADEILKLTDFEDTTKGKFKQIIEKAISPIRSKILRKYGFKDLAEKTKAFYENFKNLVEFAQGDLYKFDIQTVADFLQKELQADVETIGNNTEEEGEKKKPMSKEELESILQSGNGSLQNNLIKKYKDPSKAIARSMFGLYGEEMADYVNKIVASKLTTEGVRDAREKQEKIGRLTQVISDQGMKNQREYYQSGSKAIAFMSSMEEMLEIIYGLPDPEETRDLRNIEKGIPPQSTQAKIPFKKANKIFPDFLKRLGGSISPNLPKKMFMEDFKKNVDNNPDLISNEEEFTENPTKFYREFLENEENKLTIYQLADLLYLRNKDKESTSDTKDVDDEPEKGELIVDGYKFEDLMQLNKRGMQALISKISKPDLAPALAPALANSSEDVREFFLRYLKPDRKEQVRQSLDYHGNIAPEKSRKAQKNILTAAVELINDGKIFLEQPDEENLEEALKPIIATMLKEHYNY